MKDNLYEKIASMTKSEITEELEKLNEVKKHLENKLLEPDAVSIETYDACSCWMIETYSHSPNWSGKSIRFNPSFAKNGCYRMTSENAKKASIRRINANIIEAYAEKIEPSWIPDWNNKEQEKCSIAWDFNKQKFTVVVNYTDNIIGVPIMSLSTAHRIKKMLNAEEIKLLLAGEKNES